MVKSIEEQEVNAQTKSTKDIAFLKKEIESLKGLVRLYTLHLELITYILSSFNLIILL